MLRIAKLTDYGIVLLTYMAQEPDQQFSAREMADASQLPKPTVTTLLKLLSSGGLLSSSRGAQGGYYLAKPPEEVTVAEIVSLLEGPIRLTECATCGAQSDCELEPVCPVRSNWQIINEAIVCALDQVTLLDMATKIRARKSDRTRILPLVLKSASARR